MEPANSSLSQPLNINRNDKQSNKWKKYLIGGCLVFVLILISVVIWLYFDTIQTHHEWTNQQIDFNYIFRPNSGGSHTTSGAIIKGNGYFWPWSQCYPMPTCNVSSFNRTGSPLHPSTLLFPTQIIPNHHIKLHTVQNTNSRGIKSVVINDTIYSIATGSNQNSLYSYDPIINNKVSEYIFIDSINSVYLTAECIALNPSTNSIYIIQYSYQSALLIFDVDSLSFTHFYNDTGLLYDSDQYSYSCIFNENNTLYAFGVDQSSIYVLDFDDNNTLIGNQKWTKLKSFELEYPLTNSYAVTFDHNIIDIIGCKINCDNHYDKCECEFISQTLNLKESNVTHSSMIDSVYAGYTHYDCLDRVGSSVMLVDYQYNKTYLMVLDRSNICWKVYYRNPTINKQKRLVKVWNQFIGLDFFYLAAFVLGVWVCIVILIFVYKDKARDHR